MQQNTTEWLEYRKGKIGASDASVIMGLSPWSTPYDLWMEKKGLKEPKKMTPAMQRGIDLQDVALEEFTKKTGLQMFPEIRVHPRYDWMIASLDGITLDGQHIVEVKCPGARSHALAVDGIVPEYYMPQLQHQLEVCGHEHMYYYSFDGVNGVVLDVFRNESYIEQMLEKEMEFWELLQGDVPPEKKQKKKGKVEWTIEEKEFIDYIESL